MVGAFISWSRNLNGDISCRVGAAMSDQAAIADPGEFFPLVHLAPKAEYPDSDPPAEASKKLVHALQNSGFLLVTTPLVPKELQRRALHAATRFLESDSEKVITHPSDPKRYCMLDRKDLESPTSSDFGAEILEYFNAVERAKMTVLRCLASGLGLGDPSHFARLHSEGNSSLRLLRYPAAASQTGNRCKEHSDYGTITLLLTDGVSGLEAHHEGQWLPVPHVEGALVVNVGSLLSEWTGGSLKATLHRVAGPASIGSETRRDVLLEAAGRARTSLAFFADPDGGVKARLAEFDSSGTPERTGSEMSVAEYIQYRSGGSYANDGREGVAFTKKEAERVKGCDDGAGGGQSV